MGNEHRYPLVLCEWGGGGGGLMGPTETGLRNAVYVLISRMTNQPFRAYLIFSPLLTKSR